MKRDYTEARERAAEFAATERGHGFASPIQCGPIETVRTAIAAIESGMSAVERGEGLDSITMFEDAVVLLQDFEAAYLAASAVPLRSLMGVGT